MTRERTPLVKTGSVIGVALLVGLVAAFAIERFPMPPGRPPEAFMLTIIRIELFITTFNLVVLLALAGSYVSLYRELPNKYTRSLLILSLALVFYAFSSNPLTPFLFGFPPKPDLGPFVFLPDLFIAIATVVLFYQSQT